MIDCIASRSRMTDYLYELLPDWQELEVREHLQACGDCREALEELRSRLRIFDTWKAPPLSQRFQRPPWRSVKDVARSMAPSPAHRFRRAWLGPAIALAIILVVGLGPLTRWMAGSLELRTAGAILNSTAESGPLHRSESRQELASWLLSQTGFAPAAPDLRRGGLQMEGVRAVRGAGATAGEWVYRMGSAQVLLTEWREGGAWLPAGSEIQVGRCRFRVRHVAHGVQLVWRHSGRLFLAQGPIAPEQFARLLDRCIEAGMRPSSREQPAKGAAREPAPRLTHGSGVPRPAKPGVRL